MDNYDARRRREHIAAGAALAAAGTAAYFGRRRIAEWALQGAEALAKRYGRADEDHLAFSLVKAVSKARGLTERNGLRNLAIQQVGRSRMVGELTSSAMGWNERQADLLFAHQRDVERWTARNITLHKQHLTGDAYRELRESLGVGADEIYEMIQRARTGASIADLYSATGRGSARVAFARDANGAALRRQLSEAQTRAGREFLDQMRLASSRARGGLGTSRVTIGDILQDPALRGSFDARTATELNDSFAYISRLAGRHSDMGVDVGALHVEGLWRGASGRVYDLRGFRGLADKWTESARNNFQIPVIPYMRGFSPFSLFPWLSGNSRDFVSVLPFKGVARQLGISDTMAGREMSVALVGSSALGFQFGDAVTASSELLARDVVGIRTGGGFGRRIVENLYAANRAYNEPRESLSARSLFSPQADTSFLGKLKSVFTKYDAAAGETYPATALANMLSGNASHESVLALSSFLRNTGEISPELAAKIFDPARLSNTPLGELVGKLADDRAITAFFEEAATSGEFQAVSTRLAGLISEYGWSEGAVRYGYHPRQSRKLLGFNSLGEPDPRRGIDLMREAVTEEMVLRSAGGSEASALERILASQGLGDEEREKAISFVQGTLLGNLTQTRGYEAAAAVLTHDEASARLVANARHMTDRYLSRLDAHVPIVDDPDMPGLFLVRDHASILGQINESLKDGRGVAGAIRDLTGSAAVRQYTSAWVKGIRDPANFTRSSINAYFFEERLNRMLTEFGLGLGPKDLGSSFDVFKGLMTKRLLPAWAAYEAYNYINYETEEQGLPSPRRIWANVKANIKLARARILGSEHFDDLYPGLEKYVNSTTYDQEKERLATGYEPVRASRFWLFGSRSEFMGGKVRYYLPDHFQKAHSRWDASGNADQNSAGYWAHSAIPTPAYPLSPIARILDPYWWESKHAGEGGDRPYVTSGPLFAPETPWGPVLNATVGELVKPTKVLRPEYDPNTAAAHKALLSGSVAKAGRILAGIQGLFEPYGETQDSGQVLEGAYAAHAADDAATFTLHAGSTAKILPAGGTRILGRSRSAYGGAAPLASAGGGQGGGASEARAQLAAINARLKGGGPAVPIRLADHNASSAVGVTGDPNDVEYTGYAANAVESVKEHLGIYGWLVERFFGKRPTGLRMDDASHGYGFATRAWDAGIGGLGGELSEITRKFLPHRPRTVEWYNPVPNQNWGTWLPGDDYFVNLQRGDPYTAIENGLLRLPGEAYERVHGIKLLQSRASSLGRSVDEQVLQLIHATPPLDEEAERVVGIGNDLHKAIQRKWRSMGILKAEETTIYDDRLGVSGHIDALLEINGERLVGEIKTMSGRRYHANRLFDEHLDQLNFYLKTTGIKRGLLAYVNRDDPNEVRLSYVNYSPARQRRVEERLEEARSRVRQLVNEGVAPRTALYDDVTRFEILSDVAPYSRQWAAAKSALASNDQLSDVERERVRSAKKRASAIRKRKELYSHHFSSGTPLVSAEYTVKKILDANSILTTSGDVVRLTGVRASNERVNEYADSLGEPIAQRAVRAVGGRMAGWIAEGLKQTKLFSSTRAEGIADAIRDRLKPDEVSPAERLYAKFGIRPGSALHVKYSSDPTEARGADMFNSLRAVVYAGGTNINRLLLATGIAEEKEGDWSAAGVEARFSRFEQAKGRLWEEFAHLDTPFHTKFLRVRSPYEAYVREQVYGKESGGWDHPVADYILPTIDAYVARNPLVAGLSMGLFASMFTPARGARLNVGLVAGGIGAVLSMVRSGFEGISGRAWIPGRVQKRRELEQYWDTIKYLKYKGLADYANKRAISDEGTNIEALEAQAERGGDRRTALREMLGESKRSAELSGSNRAKKHIQIINARLKGIAEKDRHKRLGPWATQAMLYRTQHEATMYGLADGAEHTELMRALPKYEREIFAGILEDSTPAERKRFYRLLPDYQKRIMAGRLGIKDKTPELPDLAAYFRTHTLPDEDWEGWRPDVDLSMLRARAIEGERLDPMDFGLYPQQIAQSEAVTRTIEVPTLTGRSSDIRATLERVLAGAGLATTTIEVQAVADPNATHDSISYDVDLAHDRHGDLITALRHLH